MHSTQSPSETTRAAGFHREVCIDEMKFNPDGTIIQVKPTHKGVGLK